MAIVVAADIGISIGVKNLSLQKRKNLGLQYYWEKNFWNFDENSRRKTE